MHLSGDYTPGRSISAHVATIALKRTGGAWPRLSLLPLIGLASTLFDIARDITERETLRSMMRLMARIRMVVMHFRIFWIDVFLAFRVPDTRIGTPALVLQE